MFKHSFFKKMKRWLFLTCVVGIITPQNNIIMAADSANLEGFGAYTTMKNQKKVFKLDEMLIGVAGNNRIGQILNHDFNPPTDKYKDPFLYLIKEFVPSLKTKLKEEFDNSDSLQDTDILIGYRNRLFRLSNNYSIIESSDDYDAIGTGRYDARGALFALKHTESISCKEMVHIAVSAAINADVNIKPPIQIENLK